MARAHNHGSYKDGYWQGMTEWRYGSEKKVSLAGPDFRKPIMNKDRRRHVIHQTIDAMRHWQLSPFEHEGSARHGLRSALCLQGHGWQVADREAAGIVAEALRQIGAQRPSWDEGQREYSVPEENCRWCHMPIAEEDRTGNRNNKFCSVVCAKAAWVHREYRHTRASDAIVDAAYRLILKERNAPRTCLQCGNSFRPTWDGANTMFCSLRCANARRRVDHHAECQQCGTAFTAKMKGRKYCSPECSAEANKRLEKRICKGCHNEFQPRHSKTVCCSVECVALSRRRLEDKTCPTCKSVFRGNTAKNIYCSRACSDIGRRAPEQPCDWCTKTFRPRNTGQRFCSKSCSGQASVFASGHWRPTEITPPVFDYTFREAA